MRRAIATVCLSGLLTEKLEAIAAAGFDGAEIFENDLLQFYGKPREVREIAQGLGLAIDMFQPFRDFDAPTPALLARSLDRAERKFDLMAELGTDLVLVCSNVQPDAIGDLDRLAEQYTQLAERAAARGISISFEALAWGTQIKLFAQAWAVVQRVARPNFGLTLDSFHTLSLRDDPAPIAKLPGDRIFYVQLADAPWVNLDVLTHSRHYRCFPGQGEFELVGFMRALLASGYAGTISLEIFNDEFRAAPARQNAIDAMRSLLWLEDQVGRSRSAAEPGGTRWNVPLFEPPPAPAASGWSFVEFAVDRAAASRLAQHLVAIGFALIGRHRSKDVELYAMGTARIVLNLEEDSFARSYFDSHGTAVCALALATADAGAAIARAEAFGSARVAGRVGTGELDIPAVSAPDGSLLYFCTERPGERPDFEADFELDATALAAASAVAGARFDHIVHSVPAGQLEPWVLFERTVVGLVPQRGVVLNDPYGVIRSRELESDDRALRMSLMVSERENTTVARSISRFHGAGVQQIAIVVDDVIGLVSELRKRGAPVLPVPDNYYDDLAAKYALDEKLLAAMSASGVLYERVGDGELLHAYVAPFDDRFEFEFIERRGGYGLYGSTNSPVRLAALAQWRAREGAAGR